MLLGGFGVYFQKHALEEHKFSSFNHCTLQERMWKGYGKREAEPSGKQDNFLLCQISFLIQVLGQNVTREQEQCSCQAGMSQCPAVLLLHSFRIKRALKQLLAQVCVYSSLPPMFLKPCMAQELFSKHWKHINKVLRWQHGLPDSSQAFWGPSGNKWGSWFCLSFEKSKPFLPQILNICSLSACSVYFFMSYSYST